MGYLDQDLNHGSVYMECRVRQPQEAGRDGQTGKGEQRPGRGQAKVKVVCQRASPGFVQGGLPEHVLGATDSQGPSCCSLRHPRSPYAPGFVRFWLLCFATINPHCLSHPDWLAEPPRWAHKARKQKSQRWVGLESTPAWAVPVRPRVGASGGV